MSHLPSYTHLTDAELLRECDQHYADGLIVELARRLAELSDERGALLSELEDKDTEIDRLKSEIDDLEAERDEERERADNAELVAKERLDQIHELEETSDELRTLLQAADNQIFSLKGEVLELKQVAQ